MLPLTGLFLECSLIGFAVNQQGIAYVANAGEEARFVNTADGWLIRYPIWQEARPRRIDLQRLTNQAGNVNLRIVLDQWQEKSVTGGGAG